MNDLGKDTLQPYAYVWLGVVGGWATDRNTGKVKVLEMYAELLRSMTPMALGRLRAAVTAANGTNCWYAAYYAAELLRPLLGIATEGEL